MNTVIDFILRHGTFVVFGAVLAEQLGLPVPSAIVLLATGAAIGMGEVSFVAAIAAAVTAALLGDLVWYELGARRGRSVLATLCRVSRNLTRASAKPKTCTLDLAMLRLCSRSLCPD